MRTKALQINSYSKKRAIVFIMMGIFVFSTFMIHVYMQFLGLPNGPIEFFLLPISIILIVKYKIRFHRRDIFYSILFLIVCSLLGMISFPFTITELIPTIRAFTIFLYTFLLFKNKPVWSVKDIHFLTLGSLFGNILTSYFNIKNVANLEGETGYITDTAVAAIAMFASSSLAISKGSIYRWTCLIFAIVSSLASFSRGIMLISIMSVLVALFLEYNTSFKKSIRSILIISVVGAVSFFFYVSMEPFFEATSHTMHARLYLKVRGEAVTGDDDRMDHYRYMISNADRYVFPRGFESYARNEEPMMFNEHRDIWMMGDCSISEIFYTFGIFSILLISWYVMRIRMILVKYKKTSQTLVICTTAIVVLISSPLGNSMFLRSYSVFFLGLLAAYMINPMNLKLN